MKAVFAFALIACVLVQALAQDGSKWTQDPACKAKGGVCTDAASCTGAGKQEHGHGSDAATSDCPSTPDAIQCCF